MQYLKKLNCVAESPKNRLQSSADSNLETLYTHSHVPGVPSVPVFSEPDDHNDNVEERNTDEGEDDKESVGDEGGAGEGNVVQNYV